MIITISGEAGAGKGSVGRLLAKRLRFKFYSIGEIIRKIAREQGVSVEELNKQAEHDYTTDRLVDSYQKKLGKHQDNFVLDSRLGFYFIPHSVKVYLTADLMVRAKRIINDKRREEHYTTVREAIKKIKERKESDQRRYKKLYSIDCYNPRLYDIVIDTTKLSINEVVDRIVKKLDNVQNKKFI